MNRTPSFAHLGISLGLALATIAPLALNAIAKPPPPKAASNPTSETRQGFGCLRSRQEPLPVALNPGQILPFTVSGHPTFFWYMPQVSSGYLEFALAKPTDDTLERETIVHYVRLPIPRSATVVAYQLPPEHVEALEYGQLYRWSVVLFCRVPGEINYDLSDGLVTSGWVERLATDDPITLQVADATPEQSDRFAAAGIWHEALTGLARQQLLQPQDAQTRQNWFELLASVGLENFAQFPILFYRPEDVREVYSSGLAARHGKRTAQTAKLPLPDRDR